MSTIPMLAVVIDTFSLLAAGWLIKSLSPVVVALALSEGVAGSLNIGSLASRASLLIRGREALEAGTHIQAGKITLRAPRTFFDKRATITVGGKEIDPEEGKAAPAGVTVIEGEGLVLKPGTATGTKPEAAEPEATKPAAEASPAKEGGATVIEGEGLVLKPGSKGNSTAPAEATKPEAATPAATKPAGGAETAKEGGATVIEGEGLVLTPGGKGTAAEPAAEPAKEGAEGAAAEKEEEPKEVTIGGTPFLVSGEGVTVNGKPLEAEGEAKAEPEAEEKEEPTAINIGGTPFLVSGEGVTVNGKPLEAGEVDNSAGKGAAAEERL
ncbi:hypothetical protein GQ53DRAFT_817394 [Thozetella sp. PMI_491]|nr:hypothetical protein GQ53DRAFT_817394 [Thozetella sp. PMI_491]